jgi:prepilin-type N-terminal cleavage/methylation domain-containing protein
VDEKNRNRGFTLLELITVIALISLFIFFLIKLNITSDSENQQLKIAATTLTSCFDDGRNQAILGNIYTRIAIDISSNFMFRRVIMMKQFQDNWLIEREIFLPGKIFILPLNVLSEYLEKDLSRYHYWEEEVILPEGNVNTYTFIFNPEGYLDNTDLGNSVLGIGPGVLQSESIKLKKDVNVYSILITTAGRSIILESKNAMKEAL